MYRDKPSEAYYSDNDMFVDLDRASGGYPTRANMLNAHSFKDAKEALAYDSKGEFILAELSITGITTVDEIQDQLRSCKNKELLEKEARRKQYESLKKEFG